MENLLASQSRAMPTAWARHRYLAGSYRSSTTVTQCVGSHPTATGMNAPNISTEKTPGHQKS